MEEAAWVTPSSEVKELADAFGVATEYRDQSGNLKQVSAQTLERILTALTVDVATPAGRAAAMDRVVNGPWRSLLPTVVVTRQGHVKEFAVHVLDGDTIEVSLQTETGELFQLQQNNRYVAPREIDGKLIGEATFEAPADLPLGWHVLKAKTDSGQAAESVLVCTPNYLGMPAAMENGKTWGLMAQMYATRSRESWGLGDLQDLAKLSSWGGSQGAGFVLVNPMHAAEVAPPMAPSPYLPATRRYFNPIYLNIESIPEFALASAEVQKQIAALAEAPKSMNATADLLDRDLVWSAKQKALELLLTKDLSATRQAEFDSYAKSEGVGLTSFATWCVLAEQFGITNKEWDAGLQRPDSEGVSAFKVKNAARIDFYTKLQWLLDEQFASVQAAAKSAGMSAGVVHDLAVGVHPEGADAWALQDVLAHNVSVGAPPDMFNQMGQDWSQPPWRPDALVANAYIPYRDMLRTILRHSGGIRVDHALGLFRLWWIPTELGAANGTFVKYDHEALVGILALEAQRVGAFVVGEDLGTVEPWIVDYLAERGIAGTSILFFERDRNGPVPPENWRELCLATVTVHDIPPSAGFIDGEHIRMRHDLGLLARPVESEWSDHAREMKDWDSLLNNRGWMRAEDPSSPTVQEKVEGLHRIVAHTPCKLAAIALPDLVGDMRSQNQPGTDQEYPNWRVPTCHADGVPFLIEHLTEDVEAKARAARLIAAMTESE
jgi:4-alpha-glucanotransferase